MISVTYYIFYIFISFLFIYFANMFVKLSDSNEDSDNAEVRDEIK